MKRAAIAALVLVGHVGLLGQAPDGDAVLRGAGVNVPRRGGSEAAFDRWMSGPAPVPPGAFATLIIGMGPVGDAARIRAIYAFGVLAGRSARTVPPGELAGAGVALVQSILGQDRGVRIAAARVGGRVFAAPLDGGPPPVRPAGLEAGLFALLNQQTEPEQLAAMEGLGLIKELAAVQALAERYAYGRKTNKRALAGGALEALTRIGDPSSLAIVKALSADVWGDRDDLTGLVAAYARERYLKDGSVGRLQVKVNDERLGPNARAYLAELGVPVP